MASLLDIAPPGQPWLSGQPWRPSSYGGVGAIDRGSVGGFGYSMEAQRQMDDILRERQERARHTPPGALAPPTTATGNTTNPFTAETLVRNPELAAALKKLYGDIGSLSTDPNANQTVLQRNTKLPEVEAAGQAALKTQQADATNNAQSIADFTKDFMAAQPAAVATANQEAGAIGRLYDGAYAKDLEDNRRKTGILTTQNLLRRIGMIGGAGNMGDLSRGGVTNSLSQANLMREVANASLSRDLEFQGQERGDIMDIQNRQSGNAGLRQRLIDSVLQRPLTPIQAGQSVAGNDVNRLNSIASLLSSNSVITPQTRAGLIQQVQQLLSGQGAIDSAANWRYTRGDFPDQLPGVVPQQRLRLPNPNDRGGGGGLTIEDVQAMLDSQGGQPSLSGGGSASGNSGGNFLPPVNRVAPADPYNNWTWEDFQRQAESAPFEDIGWEW